MVILDSRSKMFTEIFQIAHLSGKNPTCKRRPHICPYPYFLYRCVYSFSARSQTYLWKLQFSKSWTRGWAWSHTCVGAAQQLALSDSACPRHLEDSSCWMECIPWARKDEDLRKASSISQAGHSEVTQYNTYNIYCPNCPQRLSTKHLPSLSRSHSWKRGQFLPSLLQAQGQSQREVDSSAEPVFTSWIRPMGEYHVDVVHLKSTETPACLRKFYAVQSAVIHTTWI